MTANQMQDNLTMAKEARKRAELDAQLLANRIALLKQEGDKAHKKIEDTRKRTDEINALKKQNEDKFHAKEIFYREKWNSIRTAQATNSAIRDKGKAQRDSTRTGLLDQKQQNARERKFQSQQMLQQKKDREQLELQQNTDRSNYLKQKKEDGKRKLEEDRLAQLEKFREDYECRTAQEDMLRSRTDALVAQMEKEEIELIERLQNTQAVQRTAYEELEGALGQGSVQTSSGTKSPSGGGAPQGSGNGRSAGCALLAERPRPAA